MTGLGDRLKEARMAKGFTLDDLQSITKIQKRYLSSIEKEEYGMMPGSFYVRAFIKQYAEAVGLDPEELLLLYKESPEAILPEEEEHTLTSPSLKRSNSRRTSELAQIMPKLIFALFVVVAIVVAWFLWNANQANNKLPEVDSEEQIKVEDQQKTESSSDDEAEKEDTEKQPDNEPETEPETENVEQTLENSSIDGQNSIFSLTGAKEFKIEIRTSDASWMSVLDSNSQEIMPDPVGAYTMGAGDNVEIDATETDSVRIRVGNYKVAEIYVNGELVEYVIDRVPQNVIIEYKKE